MSIEYIRKTYGTDVKIGQTVRIRIGCGSRFDGMHGKLIRAQGPWLKVKGDTWRGNFHPSDVEPIAAEIPA